MIALVICSAPLLVSALGMVESAHMFLFENYQMRVWLCDAFFMVFTWPLFLTLLIVKSGNVGVAGQCWQTTWK